MMFPDSDRVGQYSLREPLQRKGVDSTRCRGKSARTGGASQQRSRYSSRLQHSTPKLKVIFSYLLVFSGFLFLSINLGLRNGTSRKFSKAEILLCSCKNLELNGNYQEKEKKHK